MRFVKRKNYSKTISMLGRKTVNLAVLSVFVVSLLIPFSSDAKTGQMNIKKSFDGQKLAKYNKNWPADSASTANTAINQTQLSAVQQPKPLSVKASVQIVTGTLAKLSQKNKENKEKEQVISQARGIKPPKSNESAKSVPDRVVKAVLTAYTSTPDQTDDTPFIAASGRWVYDGMIAANWLPFGTKVKIPSLFGDKIFTVDDRMNTRYGYGHVDIWLDATRVEALKFGVKHTDIEIYYDTKVVQLSMR